MADVASLVVKVSTEGVNKAQDDLAKLAKQSKKTSDDIDEMSKMMKRATDIINKDPFQKYKQSLLELNTLHGKGLLTNAQYNAELKNIKSDLDKAGKSATGATSSFSALYAIMAAGAVLQLAKQFATISDNMTLVEARIRLVSKASEDYMSIQNRLLEAANENRVSFKEMGELYARLATPLKSLGANTQTIIDITDAFGKTLLISGASASEANGAIRQFSQAMASGVLRGEEFNSMMENAPRAMKSLQESLGKTQGELRKMAENGELAAGVVAGALLRDLTRLEEEASRIPKTIGGEFEKLWNQLGVSVQKFNEVTEANKYLAGQVTSVTNALEKMTIEFVKASKAKDDFLKENNAGFAVMEEIAAVAGTINEKQVFKNLFDKKEPQDFTTAMTGLNTEMATFNAIVNQGKGGMSLGKSIAQMREDAAKNLEAQGKAELERQRLEKERKEAEKKAQREAIKLSEDWATRKIEIDTNMAIAEQDEMAKPFILLSAKYDEDMAHFKNNKEAQLKLTEEFNAEFQRLAKDANKVLDEKSQKSKQKDIQKELKLQEENFRIQARQIDLLDDEADRQVALATLERQRTEASLKAQMELGEVTPQYYDAMMEMEDKLLEKQKQNWTIYGQIINNTTGAMESSFMDFFDATSDGYMKLGDLAKNILQEMYKEAIRVALVKPLVGGITSFAMSAVGDYFGGSSTASAPTASTYDINTGGSLTNAYFKPNAKGGAYNSPSLSQYSGQIVDKPTFFAFAQGGTPNMGVMGEAGSEAIMPLTRTSSGDLGVKAIGGGSNVIINISNETGMPIDLKQLTKSKDDKGNEIRSYVMKFAGNDPEFRNALGISR